MKRSLALSFALVVSSAALAQSSMTVYGKGYATGFTSAPAFTASNGDGSLISGWQNNNFILHTDNSQTNIGGNVGEGNMSINADGTAVVGNVTTGSKDQIARYDIAAGTWTSYGDLGFHSGSTYSTGYGISGDGNTLAGQAYYNTSGTTGSKVNAFIARTGGNTDLYPTTAASGRAEAANEDGTVIGGMATTAAAGIVWTYSGGAWTTINATTVYGGSTINAGEVSKISRDGTTAACNFSSTAGGLASVFNIGTGIGQNILRASTWADQTGQGFAEGITGNGSMVVGTYVPFGGGRGNGFAWTAAGGTVDADAYATSLGVTLGTGAHGTQHITSIDGISADGSTVFGTLYDPNILAFGSVYGVSEAFIIRPASVPEPGCLLALALALPAFVKARKRASGK